MTTIEIAKALASLGLYVFPCRENKTPYPANGFYAGTTDPDEIESLFKSKPNALVGVWAGPSGIVVLDLDVKRDVNDLIVVDGYESLSEAWLSAPDTFSYTTLNGEGAHFVYLAPEGTDLAPAHPYRHMPGVDRQSGGSYVVWRGDVPASRSEFQPAPEWLLDVTEVRSRAEFDGTVEDWFSSLESGEPNFIVRKAIERARKAFEEQGNDFSHDDIVKRSHEAIRLGAEGNPGVPELLAVIEELTLTRTGPHSRPENEWRHEFVEALSTGVSKHGDAIELRKSVPNYDPGLVPMEVSDSLVTGVPGDKSSFNQLLKAMVAVEPDDNKVTAVMWGAPKTRELSREWGLAFVYKRVQEARVTPPPTKDNPTLPDPLTTVQSEAVPALLTKEQVDVVLAHPTFIDQYIDYSRDAKGWVNRDYAVPAAWTLLSMAFGNQVSISQGMPGNLWFIPLGYSGSGKSSHYRELSRCLDLLLKQPEQAYYNLGASSSPEAMHEVLLERDKQPSIVMDNEAATFFKGLARKEWMSALEHMMSDWYDGYVPPVNKVRLKELKGKSAHTSMNMFMVGTPDKVLEYVTTDLFESGFLARVNWSWGEERDLNDQRRYLRVRADVTDEGVSPVWFDCIADILYAQRVHGSARIPMKWTDEAEDILVKAHMDMDAIAQKRDQYGVTERSVTRLVETLWKCASLLAVYRGSDTISEVDALTAVYYAQTWFDNLFRVLVAAGQGEFARNMDEIETYIRRYPNGVAEAKVYNRFRGLAKFSVRDVDSLLEYLMKSNRILRDKNGKYTVNG